MTDQNTTNTPATEPSSYLNMTDEQIMSAPPPADTVDTTAAPADNTDTIVVVDKTPANTSSAAAEAIDTETSGGAATDGEGGVDDAEATGTTKVKDDDTSTDKDKNTGDDNTDTTTNSDNKPTDSSVVDYKAEYERLLTPFKANGHEIAVTSVDDAIQLMQMGANYNKKMAGLKPNLKLLKMLENGGFLSEEKVSYLIDLGNKNPGAIQKLIQESGTNPMDLSAEKAGEYKPKIHTVDDREIDLDNVLEDIASTPTYTQTLEIVTKMWDGDSKEAIAQSPQLLKVINDHVANGIYDLISKEVARERAFGRLNGLSDIKAYQHVGDAINARGGFDHLNIGQRKPAAKQVVVPPKPKVDDENLNAKKRAASSTKPAAAVSTVPKEYNPLALSDADFSKLVLPNFV